MVLAGGLAIFELRIAARDTAFDALLASVFTWLSVLAFLGYGRRYLSFENGLLRWTREASYPVYILHQTLIVALAYVLIPLSWEPWIKYWTILVATLLGSMLLFEILRRFTLSRVAFGMKAKDARSLPRQRGLAADPP